jgi:hypothetical protein
MTHVVGNGFCGAAPELGVMATTTKSVSTRKIPEACINGRLPAFNRGAHEALF